MESHSHNEDKQHAFDSFCKKVLKNEARDAYDAKRRYREREVTFSGMTEQELEQLAVLDSYFAEEFIFDVLGVEVVVLDGQIAEALRSLSAERRNIILLSYFLDMSDREISEKLNMVRRTVSRWRNATLQELKRMMEGNADD